MTDFKEGEIQQNIGKQKDIAETLRRIAPLLLELKNCGYSWIFIFENIAFGSQTPGHVVYAMGALQKRAMSGMSMETFLGAVNTPQDRTALFVKGEVEKVLMDLATQFGAKKD